MPLVNQMQMRSISKVRDKINKVTLLLFNILLLLAAMSEYGELKRELTHISRMSAPHSKLEEGDADEFDLDEYLNGLRTDQTSAGQHIKHLGLIWKDLTVMVKQQ